MYDMYIYITYLYLLTRVYNTVV